MKVLKKGDFGEDVKQWQLFLQSVGYKLFPADGAFGPLTEKETLKFQAANGLKPDGIVGEKTRNFITTVSNNTPLSNKWPKQDYTSMVNFYGPVGENTTSLEIPYPMVLAWAKNTTIRKFTCHQKCAKSFYNVFEKVLKTYGDKEIQRLRLNLFGGVLNVRKMRGGNAFSTHSWACAIDIDPDNNQLRWGKDRAKMAHPDYNDYWKFVEAEGGVSLGRQRNMDYQHWQFAKL
jgi:peptidoglycan hydrolase-like protein with peptidoglycan-binding domain